MPVSAAFGALLVLLAAVCPVATRPLPTFQPDVPMGMPQREAPTDSVYWDTDLVVT